LSLLDKNGDKYTWTMDLGVIDPRKYKADSFNYFDYFNENVLGLAPMLTDNDTLKARQFLYNFINAASQLDADGNIQYSESYAFNGGDAFTVGGNVTDYEAMPCLDQFNASVPGFVDKSLSIPEAIVAGNDSLNFSPPLYYADEDVMLKIQNYVPPMRKELEKQVLMVNTWERATLFPTFFYDYFIDTFMIPAYTCDTIEDTKKAYPSLVDLRSCYCNNGDYHTMPTINIEIKEQEFQYDLGPQNYMFLPYLTQTSVPMSKCILGIYKTNGTLTGTDYEYVVLGQRALSQLPFYTVYDRVNN